MCLIWEDNYAYAKEFIYSFTKAYPDFDVKELQRYAASKGVKIIMHHETTSSVADYERQMHDAFRFMKENGYELDITDERYHHEIYLSDPRKCDINKLKTVIRHPIKKK